MRRARRYQTNNYFAGYQVFAQPVGERSDHQLRSPTLDHAPSGPRNELPDQTNAQGDKLRKCDDEPERGLAVYAEGWSNASARTHLGLARETAPSTASDAGILDTCV
jgi:hypothetical protein